MENTHNIDSIGQSSDVSIINNAAALKKYLDKQPANRSDNPITVAIKANKLTLKRISACLNRAEKYISLDLGGSPLTTIPANAFEDCASLSSVIFQGTISSNWFSRVFT
jgi:hypothetical protein